MPRPRETTAGAARPRATARQRESDAREAQIVERATVFFAEQGFHGTTRELAGSIGISQSLLFHYFPSKAALIERVFDTLYASRWNPAWDALLRDRAQTVRARLGAFYPAYLESVLTPRWTRVLIFAALDGLAIYERNASFVGSRIVEPVAAELRAERGGPRRPGAALRLRDRELAWSLHAAVFYLSLREAVLGRPSPYGRAAAVRLAIDTFFDGADRLLAAEP